MTSNDPEIPDLRNWSGIRTPSLRAFGYSNTAYYNHRTIKISVFVVLWLQQLRQLHNLSKNLNVIFLISQNCLYFKRIKANWTRRQFRLDTFVLTSIFYTSILYCFNRGVNMIKLNSTLPKKGVSCSLFTIVFFQFRTNSSEHVPCTITL